MKISVLALAVVSLAATLTVSCKSSGTEESPLKPRLVVLTDIGPAEVEPDDNESAVRLLSYADRFEIEAVCTTVGWNCDPYPEDWAEYLYAVIDAYAIDVNNLMKRSGQSGFKSLEEENARQELGYWPSAEYIRSRSVSGSHKGGIGVIGEDNDSEGSELLIRLADEDDPRPIYVTAWGGANTLAQAIWRVQQTRSPEELKAFVHKFRLYTITDQDMVYAMRMNRDYSSHKWLRRDFEDDLLFVWDESAWLNHNDLGVRNWDNIARLIQGKGAMGNVYPHYLWGVEGDTPSFLNAMPNGLNDPEDPTQVGWGGCHEKHLSPDGETNAWTNWHQPLKDISSSYEHKFYPDEFNDFAARMQWADTGEGNHNPTPVVNGSRGLKPLVMTASAGQTIKFDASASFDEDGDVIAFNWWFQQFPETTEYPSIDNPGASEIKISIPENAAPGCRYDLVCELHDDGAFTLPAYRRAIITVK